MEEFSNVTQTPIRTMIRRLVPLIILPLLAARTVMAWGPEGHRTVASLALELLEKNKPDAAAKVKQILEGESVEDASIWPDDVRPNRIASRSGRFANTEVGKAFNSAHPDNPQWHYVDLPLDSKSYGSDKRFIRENDIVATLVKCIDVLEGRSDFMTKHEAMRFLLHLGGDVHQPLHVASGVFKFDADGRATIITDPEEAAGHPEGNDSGANKILLEKNLPLHKYWDENVVSLNADNEAELAKKLRDRVAAFKSSNQGPARDWPANWATDSIGISRQIYGELKFGKRFPRTGNYWTLYINFRSETKEKFVTLAAGQLVKAARNLAELLAAMDLK